MEHAPLALDAGQMLQLVGEGMLRPPSEAYSGHGEVVKYNPGNRTYDIRLFWDACRQGRTSRDFVDEVPARYVKPLFWEAKDPAAAAQLMQMRSEEERLRIAAAKSARAKSKDAHLALPVGMMVECSNGRSGTVESYCCVTQMYKVRSKECVSSSAFCSASLIDLPASEVVPYIWEAEDPAAEADQAVAAHKAELLRCEEAAACEERLRE